MIIRHLRDWADFKLNDFSFSFLRDIGFGIFMVDVFVNVGEDDDRFVQSIAVLASGTDWDDRWDHAKAEARALIKDQIQEALRLREHEIGAGWALFKEP